jgi:hypothetical protein
MDGPGIKKLGVKGDMGISPTIYVFYKNREPPQKLLLGWGERRVRF